MMDRPEHLQMLDEWLRSYQPEELFDEERKTDSGIKGTCTGRGFTESVPIRMQTAVNCYGICACLISGSMQWMFRHRVL